MTVDIEATNLWGKEYHMTIDVRSDRDAEQALQQIYSAIPPSLRQTFSGSLHGANIPRFSERATLPEFIGFPIVEAREGISEECGYGNWWLNHDNIYLTDGGLTSLRARGTWENYSRGGQGGTSYRYESGAVVRLVVTPDLWETTISAVRDTLKQHRETRRKMSEEARKLLACLAER